MAVFTFTGDPRAPGTDPATCEMYGVQFALGEPTTVPDDVADRLRKHSHFTEGAVGQKPPVSTDPAASSYRAVHNGGPRFIIVLGDEKVISGLTKHDADTFNALSDEDKAKKVAAFKARYPE